MAETTAKAKATKAKTAKPETETAPDNTTEAKAKFAKALEEAKAGAEALGKEAQQRAGEYRERLHDQSESWQNDAKSYADQAKTQFADLARDGKTRTSAAISSLGRLVAENAPTLDEKLGPKYGKYARDAAGAMENAATKLDAKELDEIGEDAKEFVRKSPGLAVGMAAVAGYMLARIFRGSKG